MSSMVILMGAAAIAPALEPISKAFPDQTAFMISLVITLPALASALAGFGMGYLADRFGKAKFFIISLIIFTASGVFGFFAESFYIMLASRFILGVGIAGISLTTSALIGEYYFGAKRAKVVGYQSAAIGAGTFVLESIGGGLADLGWHEPFLIYLIGIPIVLLGFLAVREPSREVRSVEGFTEPVIPNKSRRVMFCYMVVAAEMFMMFALPVNFSFFISEIGLNYLMCGVLLGILGVSQAVCSMLYSRTANKLSEIDAYAIAFLLMGIGMVLLWFANLAFIFVSMVLIGFSLGLLMPTVIGSLAGLSGPKDSGKIMGGYSVALNLSTFISAIVFTALIIPLLGSYQLTFVCIGCVAFLLFAVVYVHGRAGKVKVSVERTQTAVIREPVAVDSIQMYKSILIATDGSESGMYAFKTALNIAKKNGSEITALYVFEPESYFPAGGYSADSVADLSRKVSKEIFDQVTALAGSYGVGIMTKVVSGHPANSIIDESRNHDLVVCGSLGRTNVKRVLMGSVAEKVARMAFCPVLICRDYHGASGPTDKK